MGNESSMSPSPLVNRVKSQMKRTSAALALSTDRRGEREASCETFAYKIQLPISSESG